MVGTQNPIEQEKRGRATLRNHTRHLEHRCSVRPSVAEEELVRSAQEDTRATFCCLMEGENVHAGVVVHGITLVLQEVGEVHAVVAVVRPGNDNDETTDWMAS